MIAIPTTIHDAIGKFIKLTPLRDDPKHTKWVRDEFDLVEALEILLGCYNDTRRPANKPMYVGDKSFDFTEDVKRAIEENLLGARDQKDILINRKYNITMYHLVIEPIIHSVSTMQHADVLDGIELYIKTIINEVLTSDIDPHMDDAIVMREIINAAVRERDAIRKQQKTARRTQKRQPVIIEDVEDVDDIDMM